MMMKSAIPITRVQVFGNVCVLVMTEEGSAVWYNNKEKG